MLTQLPFSTQDLAAVGFLIFLEGILSVDNALVLALLARGLPQRQQRKALTYGLVGAVVFRFISLFLIRELMRWRWVKFAGGGYLLFVALKHFVRGGDSNEVEDAASRKRSFWKTVVLIELMDIAFAVDSILAAVAVSPKFWVVFTGGILGVVLMRFAASMFLKLLERFPRFETSAYVLILIIGAKLVLEGFHLEGIEFDSPAHAPFWVFWGSMLAGALFGFIPKRRSRR